MKTTVRPSSWLPVEPDFFCWSTWMATAPARCTWRSAGGPARTIALRRLSTRLVMPVWSPWPTSDSTCNCSACPSPDVPRSVTRATVGTERRSCRRVFSDARSAVVSCPWLTAATTGTGIRFVAPNGLALLPCVTLDSDGRKCGTANVASSHTTTTTHRNLTVNFPIAPKIPSIRTRRSILVARCEPAEPGVTRGLHGCGEGVAKRRRCRLRPPAARLSAAGRGGLPETSRRQNFRQAVTPGRSRLGD